MTRVGYRRTGRQRRHAMIFSCRRHLAARHGTNLESGGGMPSSEAALGHGGFTSARAHQVAAEACRAVGLDADGARLIRLGENALFRLVRRPVIVRIARSEEYREAALLEVRVARWLAAEGFPAARIVEDVEQAVVVSGHPVTFWHLIEEGDREATYGELGAVLRDLHALPVPRGLDLPPFDALGRSALRIERAVGIPEEDRDFLRRRRVELSRLMAKLDFELPSGPVHGDAHTNNLMVDPQGRVHLIDFETFCRDHGEWDLMVAAHEYDRLGWVSDEQYAAFSGAYGRDLREWPGFETLCAIQEFKMTTWLMQNVRESAETAAEYGRRIASLRDDHAPRNWQPG
ncbi:phosphotransferase enzyme family protein [Streptomyces sp. NPDC087270]|uniref:phosphotransferase enzyme family protein n=1 Tax=Streptomyces sp. NPDC087270 TaxID=3365774 RepID=UPI0038241B98